MTQSVQLFGSDKLIDQVDYAYAAVALRAAPLVFTTDACTFGVGGNTVAVGD